LARDTVILVYVVLMAVMNLQAPFQNMILLVQ